MIDYGSSYEECYVDEVITVRVWRKYNAHSTFTRTFGDWEDCSKFLSKINRNLFDFSVYTL